MIIEVRYFGISSLLAGHEPQNVELPEDTNIEQLLNKVSFITGTPIDVLVKSAVFLVNKSSACKDTILHNGDKVLILHALGGG